MNFGSVCSGIEAVSVAWLPLGFWPEWFSEIDPYCSEVIHQRHGFAPNLGDMTEILSGGQLEGRPAIDVLVGGTPCQSFSVAGLRGGLDDERGNLALEFCRLAQQLRPRWVVWENVPGALSIDEGRAFGSIVGALHQCGYGVCWRVLNAQYFGVPQRRRRVFVVGYLGDWRRAAAVLFESEGLRGNPTARPVTRQDVAGTLTQSAAKRRGSGQQPETLVVADTLQSITDTLTASDPQAGDAIRQPILVGPHVAAPLTAGSSPNSAIPGRHREDDENFVFSDHQDALVFQSRYARNGRGVPSSKVTGALTAEPGSTGKGDSAPLVFDPAQITHPENRTRDLSNAPTLTADSYAPTIAYHVRPESGSGSDLVADETDVAYGLNADADSKQTDRGTRVLQNTGIRRLTPRECERLQGFPDNYTAIDYPSLGKPASDSQRYRALGNSMAVPVMGWLGRRILFVDKIGDTK